MHLPRPTFLIFINALILLAVFMLMGQSLVLVKRLAKAEYVTGTVEVRESGKGEWKVVSDATLLRPGDMVRSGKDGSAEFKWADGTRWKMLPQTELTLKESAYNSMKKAERSKIYLDSGKVFLRVTKAVRPDAKFEVETPGGLITVGGTILSIEVEKGKTETAVFRGSIQLLCGSQSPQQREDLFAGEVGAFDLLGHFTGKQKDDRSSEFAEHETIVRPRLKVSIKPMRKKNFIISGSTEAGSDLVINEKEVLVLGNGSFMFRVSSQNTDVFTITSTDQYGSKTTKVLQAPQDEL